METIAFYLLMVQKFFNLKQKILKKSISLVFRKHFKRIFVDYIKKTGLNKCFYDFSVDHDAIAVEKA